MSVKPFIVNIKLAKYSLLKYMSMCSSIDGCDLWHNHAMLPPIIIDIEASGFGRKGYPIEVGFIAENAETWCALVRPEDSWEYWDASAENAHHIKRDVLFIYGKTAKEVAQQLNQKLWNKTVYSDGWGHDYVWISQLFDAAEMTPHFKLEDLRSVLTPEQEATWHATKEEVQQELNATRHRASIDAKVLQLTWLRTRNKLV